MKLSELEPQFLRWYQRPHTEEERRLNPQFGPDKVQDIFAHVATLGEAHGIIFVCPKSRMTGEDHYTQVWFAGSPVPPHIGKNKEGKTVRWTAAGTGYGDLTLQPSIEEQDDHCKWHGHVTNGDAS